MSSSPLTAANARRAHAGDVLWDQTVPGLHLRVFPGKAVYSLYYRSPTEVKPNRKPVERRLRLGTADALSLPEARELARLRLSEVAKGDDPAMEKRRRAGISTLDEFFETVHASYWSAERFERSGWKDQVRRFYNHDIKPRFGGRRITDDFNDLEEWHEAFAKGKKPRPNAGNRALAIFSKVLNLAETKRYGKLRPLNSNPCSSIERHPERKRDRVAAGEEIAKVGALLNKYADQYPVPVAFLYLLIYSGSRPSAIERVTWEQLSELELNGEVWGILKFWGKGQWEMVYVPPQAMTVVRKLPRTQGTITGMSMPRKFWDKVRTEAGCPDLWMRDWRRTFATVGVSNGQALNMISELFNHRSTQTTKRYALMMHEPKIKAAGAVAGHLEALLKAG